MSKILGFNLCCLCYNYVINFLQYSGWAPQNRQVYQQVPVKFCQQDKLETVVEFLRDEMIVDDR